MSDNVERVAFLALIYRELSASCSVGERTGPNDIYDDIESGDEQDNLIRRIGSAHATPLDWAIVRLLGCDFDSRSELRKFANGLSDFDRLRFEALLHAWPDGYRLPAARLAYMERWEEVEEDIERYIALGLTATFTDVFDNFLDATAELSGGSSVEALSDHLDRIERLRGLRVVS